ncbi:TlpA family protein disulfide reductase [Butyricimonas paravirosa]
MKKIILLAVLFFYGLTVFAGTRDTIVQKDVTKWGVKSFLGKKAPALVVEKWITEEPDTVGKFVLFELYGLVCPPCWEAIPKLNALHEKFGKKMVVIGVGRHTGKMPQEPESHYYKGHDPKGVTYDALGLKFVPYALLVDPKGIVRWEGSPNDLTEGMVKQLLKKYRK